MLPLLRVSVTAAAGPPARHLASCLALCRRQLLSEDKSRLNACKHASRHEWRWSKEMEVGGSSNQAVKG